MANSVEILYIFIKTLKKSTTMPTGRILVVDKINKYTMNYTLEKIYVLVGREDKTATIIFKHESESYKIYGKDVTVLFNYTQKERIALDELTKSAHSEKQGFIKATYLAGNLSIEKIEILKTIGINSEDISEIIHFNHSKQNVYHSTQTREIKTVKIPMTTQSKGRDYDWMYGFTKRLVKDNIGITPYERNFYLAGKLYYEPDELTEQEVNEIYLERMILHDEIEYQFLLIKLMREEITDDEKKQLGLLASKKLKNAFSILDQYLQDAGSSIKKLAENNIDKTVELLDKVERFKDKKLSHNKSKLIYIDIHGYLHIFMRHVEEMKINKQFEHKDNFQWKEEDVFTVIEKVIEQCEDEIQDFFLKNPKGRYSRYGDHSLYFEGDYYTFHIESDGRVSTFHKNKK